MSEVFRKILRFLGLIEEDFGELGGNVARLAPEAPVADEYARPAAPRLQPKRPVPPTPMATRGASVSFVDDNGQPLRPRPVPSGLGEVRGITTVENILDLTIFAPQTFNEANRITQELKQGRPVVLNIINADPALRRRYIDFAAGVVSALDASIEGLEKGLVYLVAAKGVKVTPEVRARLRASKYEAMPR
jgi:FtsZ-interacting cell division protein YlmF